MSPAAGECPCCEGRLDAFGKIVAPDRFHGVPGRFEVAICKECASAATLPKLEAADLVALYPDDYSAFGLPSGQVTGAISAAIRRWQGARALRTPPLAALAGREPGRVVDVGCGRGDLAAALLRRGWDVVGVEPSPAACRVAAARGIEVRQGVLADAELQPASYDAASFNHSLEHTPDPLSELRQAADALRHGGLVLITVPNFGCWQARRFRSRWYHLDAPRHRTHFTRKGLERALRRAGFEAVTVTASSSSMGLPASLQYLVAGRCLFPAGLSLRVATGLCALAYPLVALLDRTVGEGDLLHAVARRSSASST